MGERGLVGPEGPPGNCEICNYGMSNYSPYSSNDKSG